MPLVQSRLSQYMQFTCVTHLFLKFALDVDIVNLATMGALSLFLTTDSKREGYFKIRHRINLLFIYSNPDLTINTKRPCAAPFAFYKRPNGKRLTLAC